MTVPTLSSILPTLQRSAPESGPRTKARTPDDLAGGSGHPQRAQRDQDRTTVDGNGDDATDNTETTAAGQDFLATLEAALAVNTSAATPVPAATSVPAGLSAATADPATDALATLPGNARGPLFAALSGSLPAAETTVSATQTGAPAAGTAFPTATLPSTDTAAAANAANAALTGTAPASAPATDRASITSPTVPLPATVPADSQPTGSGVGTGTSSDTGTGTGTGQPQNTALASLISTLSDETATTSDEATTFTQITAETVGAVSTQPTRTVASTDAKPATAAEATTRQVFPEITRFVQTATPGTHRLAITLHPEDLGEVKVTMIVRAGTLQVHLSADSPGARAALANGSSELHRMLELVSTGDTRVVIKDASGASTETRTGSGSAGADSGQNATGQSQHGSTGRHGAPESAEDWVQGWSMPDVDSAAARTTTPEPVTTGTAATTNPGRLDRLM